MSDPIEFIRFVAESLVDDPSEVSAVEGDSSRGRSVQLQVAPDDMGRVIGRDGRIANAMRTLLRTGRYSERWGLEVRDRE